MKEDKMEVFICSCSSLEHQLAFWYNSDDDLLYVYPKLYTYDNFFKRLLTGLKYAFGYKSRFGEFDEILLNKESRIKLLDMIIQKDKTN